MKTMKSIKGFASLCPMLLSLFALVGLQASVNAQVNSANVKAPEKLGADHMIRRFELKSARMVDGVRLLAEHTGVNVVTSAAAGETVVTIFLQDVKTSEAIDNICRTNGLWYRFEDSSNTFRVMTAEEFQSDVVVAREDETRVFTLLNPNALIAATAIRDVYGRRVLFSMGLDSENPQFEQQVSQVGSNQSGGFGSNGSFGAQGMSSSNGLFGNSLNLGSSMRGNYGAGNFGAGSSGFARSSARAPQFDQELGPDKLNELSERLAESQSAYEELLGQLDTRELPIYVTVVRQHNAVVVRTSDSKALDDITALVERLDRPTPQVLLSMKILEISLGEGFRSVFDFEYTGGGQTDGNASGQPLNPLDPDAEFGLRDVLGVGNNPLEPNSFVYQYLDDSLRARLQLIDEENRVKTVATPLILASNNLSSRLFVGEERVLTVGVQTNVITSSEGVSNSAVEPVTEIRDIGTTLIIRPKINSDRTVTIGIDQDTSSVLPGNASIPVSAGAGGVTSFNIDTVNTSQIQTTIVAKDALTVAIGGLIRKSEVDTERRVPLLGEVPLIGTLFRSDIEEESRTELVILITPYVISTPEMIQEVSGDVMPSLSDFTPKELGLPGSSSSPKPDGGGAVDLEAARVNSPAEDA